MKASRLVALRDATKEVKGGGHDDEMAAAMMYPGHSSRLIPAATASPIDYQGPAYWGPWNRAPSDWSPMAPSPKKTKRKTL